MAARKVASGKTAAKRNGRRSRGKSAPADGGGDEASRFAGDVVARGEAVKKAGRRPKLPPGVTHEIVGEDPDGTPKLRRRRFRTR